MNQSHTPQASPATFTPTHTAEGRKLTRAERKAANKAKWAAMQAAKASERKPKREPHFLEICKEIHRKYEQEQERKQAPKRKPTANERMEARAQRESIRKQEGKRAKEQAKATKVVSAVDGGEAMPFEPRMEVPVQVQERKRPVLESEPLSAYEGLTLTEAANLRKHLWMLEQDVCMDDCL